MMLRICLLRTFCQLTPVLTREILNSAKSLFNHKFSKWKNTRRKSICQIILNLSTSFHKEEYKLDSRMLPWFQHHNLLSLYNLYHFKICLPNLLFQALLSRMRNQLIFLRKLFKKHWHWLKISLGEVNQSTLKKK